MKDNGGRENGAFYGFIMRMVDRRGFQTDEETVTHGCRFPDRTRTDEEVCVRKGVTALQLSTTKLGNEPSRSLGLLPNKIYIRILKGRLFLLCHISFSVHYYSPAFQLMTTRRGLGEIWFIVDLLDVSRYHIYRIFRNLI